MKTVIALWGKANRGKTETLNMLIDELLVLGGKLIELVKKSAVV